MLTQQQIEMLLQNANKHRSATAEEIERLQQYIDQNFEGIENITKVKIIAETENELFFSFAQQSNEELSDSYFVSIPK